MRDWLNRLRPGRSDDRRDPPTRGERPRVAFADLEGSLALYVTALSDGELRITSSSAAGGGSYSDGRTIFVPPEIDQFEDLARARSLYRLMSAWKVLQVRTGSLDIRPLPDSPNPASALAFYEALHGEWLDRLMVRTWPGLARELQAFRRDALERRQAEHAMNGDPAEALLRGLLALPLEPMPGASALDRAGLGLREHGPRDGDLAIALHDILWAPGPAGSRELALELARATATPAVGAAPVVHYRGRIRLDIARQFTPTDHAPAEERRSIAPPPPPRGRAPLVVDARGPEQKAPRPPRADRRGGRQSVQLSIGDREPPTTLQQVPMSDEEKAGAALYNEWDYRQDDYLPEWCAVRQRHPRAGSSEAVEKILRQHAPLVTRLKQQFEALRPERLRLTRQLDGDDLDLSSIVEAHADRRAGHSPTEKLYSRALERDRNIALGCLIDLSGSTGAWIDDDPRNDQVIEVTRRAIVFLCEAMTMLDDRYAIYGFTSSTRKRCDLSIVKGFDETYGETVKGRISGLAPGAYTRIGPAVRHTTQALIRQPARLRLLMLISDGRPNDFDGYGGRYGIEDTRKALLEARQSGVATFALTIDAEARDYMPYMFGPSHYVVVENVPALSTRLADVYRRLTLQ